MRRTCFAILAGLTILSASAFAADSALTLANDLQAVADPMAPYGALIGTAVNTSDKQITLATITFNLFDADNNVIGNTVAQAQQIAPGQRWMYKALAPMQFDHAKISNVSVL